MSGPLPKARAVLEEGMAANLQVGAQLHVSLGGETVADLALGLARLGRPMTTGSMMTWLSCSKIATSILFARIWEQGLVGLDDPVAEHIPEFAQRGKDGVTLRHLWTHTCCLQNAEDRLFPVRYSQSHADNIALICSRPLDRDCVPGRRAAYQTSAMSLLLAEILQRKSGRDFRRIAREDLFEPLGMSSSWLGMTDGELAACEDRIGKTFDTSGSEPKPDGSFAPDAPNQLMAIMPGGNGRGPMRELARLPELLRRGGTLDGVTILKPQTVEAMTARQRAGMFDHNWGGVLDWGLGLTLDSRFHYGGAAHHYGYGPYASPRTYGHSGFRTTTAFCDPEAGLVVACSWNGMVDDDAIHSQRQNALCAAIYEDLRLA